MKAHTEYLTFNTVEQYEMVHITLEVEAIVRRSGVVDGLCFVSPMHITAAIYVNDNEDGLRGYWSLAGETGSAPAGV
jgi:thiamine phosphate synthase YjbQ (UPF0047 family)